MSLDLPRAPASPWIAITAAVALGAVLAGGAAVADRSPFPLLAALAALAGVGLVLWQPFAGLLVLVLGGQLGAAMSVLLPAGGGWLLEGVAAVTIAGLALQSFREPRGERLALDSTAFRLALLFVLAVLLSYLFARDAEAARAGLRKVLNVVLLFYLILRLTTTRRRVELVVAAILIATCLSAGLAAWGAATGTPIVAPEEGPGRLRQAGGSADPTMSSHAMLAGAALGALLALRSRRWRALGGATTLLGAVGILLTYARSPALVGLVLAVWLLYKQRASPRLPFVVAGILLVAIAAAAMMPATYWERLSALTDPDRDWTLKRRFGYHAIALDLLRDHPLLGVGPANYPSEYVDPRYRWVPGRTLEPRALHNLYLQVAVDHGLVGLACFGALLGCALRGLRRLQRGDPEAAMLAEALEFAFAGFLLACVFAPALTAKNTWILAGLAAALPRAAGAAPQPADLRPRDRTHAFS